MAERGGRTQFAVAGWLFGAVSVVPGLLVASMPTQPLEVLLYAHTAAALLAFLLVQRLKTSDPKRFSPGAAAYPR